MKLFFRMLLCSVLLTIVVACSEDEVPEVPMLEVNYTNLNGTWRLESWSAGELAEDAATYCYLSFDRTDHSYVMYDNLNSMYARKRTGEIELEQEEETKDWLLTGVYAFGKGDWGHDYIVTDLQENRLELTAKDDTEDVTVYVRCERIPEDIENGSRAL